MSSETFIELSRNTSNRTWWVKFNKTTGKILSVSAKRLITANDTEEVVNTTNTVCKDIMHGRANINQYAMHWDESESIWDIDQKSNVLEIKSKSNKLLPIQNDVVPVNSDMYIRLFKNEKILDIKINLANIRKTLNLGEIAYIKSAEENLLDIFITKKNDPDYLIATIKIDSNELFLDGRLTLELGRDTTDAIDDWSNISFYTKPVFNTYGIEIQENVILSNDLLDKKTLYQLSSSAKNAHINIYTVNGKLKISSKIEDNMLYYFEGKSKLVLHISDSEVDRYHTSLTLDTKKLIRNTIELDLPENWPDQPLFTYRNRYINLSYHGEQDVEYDEH